MPVDPDCDDGDCGDEPPDPGEECAIADCSNDACAVHDSTALGGERRSPAGATWGYWIHKPYPEAGHQLTWNTKYFTHVASDWEESQDVWGNDTLTYAGTHSQGTGAVRSGEGGFQLGDYNRATVSLTDGSYAPGYNLDPPVVFVQWRVITLNGACTFQARKFGPFNNSEDFTDYFNGISNLLGPLATWQDPYLDQPQYNTEAYLEFNAIHPWDEYEEVIPYPMYCVHRVNLPEEWFSGGVTGFEVILNCYSDFRCSPEPYEGTGENPTTTYQIQFGSGKPSFFPSSMTLTNAGLLGGQIIESRNIGRNVIITAPAHPDGWPFQYPPCQRKIEYRRTTTKQQVAVTCQPFIDNILFLCSNGTVTEEGNYIEGTCALNYLDASLADPLSGCQNSTFSGTDEECAAVPLFYAYALFRVDLSSTPNRNSADSITFTGEWDIDYEDEVDYTTHYGNTDGNPVNGYISSMTQNKRFRQGTVTITRTACNEARTADVSPVLLNGGISQIFIIDGGRCYTSPPAISISGGGGAGATAYAKVSNGTISEIVVTNPGSGYTSDPSISPFTVNGMSLAAPVLKPAPCMPEECSGFKATWMGKPKGPKGKDGSYEVEWFLIDDCPGMCTSKPPLQPTRVTKAIMVTVDCACPE